MAANNGKKPGDVSRTQGADEARAAGGPPTPICDAFTEIEGLARSADLGGRMERHPIAMVAVAVGVGYVLGGGLFRPFAARLVRIGMQAALLPLAERLITSLLTPAVPATESGDVGAAVGGERTKTGASA